MNSRAGTAARVATAVMVFVASLILFDRAVSAGLDGVYRWVEGRWAVRARLAALPDKSAYQVLVLGTSRTYEAVHPSHIERALGVKAFKEASKGKGLRYCYEFYRIYREVVGAPKVVVFGVDYFTFGMSSEASLLGRLGVAAAPAATDGRSFVPLLTFAQKERNDQVIVRILERAQRRLVSAMGELDPEFDQAAMADYTGMPLSRVVPGPEPDRYARVALTRFPGLEGDFLARLVELCAKDGVAVIFVYPPDYVGTRQTNYEHDAFAAEFRRLIAGAPDAFFFDYDDPARFPVADPSLFLDGGYGNPNSHLSRRGAERFARLYLPDLARVLGSARQGRVRR